MRSFAKPLTAASFLLLFSTSSWATMLTWETNLSGPLESPPNASPGTGFAQVDIDDVVKTMRVQVTFSGLLGTTTASHIHAATANPNTGTAGVATELPLFTGFPTGVTAGSYDHTFDMTQLSSWSSNYVNANGGTTDSALTAFIAALNAEKAYLNIHTQSFTGGEIRGFMHAVPEPATMSLLGLALVPALRRRKR